MEADSKVHPPMLAPGIDNDIYSTVDACPNTCEMWKEIERNAGYENQRNGNVAGARENVGSLVVQKSGIQCYNCKEFRHVARECQKLKREKDAAYHREKMLLCKQEEAGIQLNAEQADWRDDTDDDGLEDQELKRIICIWNNFKRFLQMLLTLDLSLMMNQCKREKINQNDDDNDLAKERELLASLIEKFKCEIDESKNRNKILETSNKVLIEKLKELARRNSKEYASQMELECAKVREMKDKLFAHQKTISILSKQKEAQIKIYKTQEDKELDKVIKLENKVKRIRDAPITRTASTAAKPCQGNSSKVYVIIGNFLMVVAVSQGQAEVNATCSYSIDIYKDIMKAQKSQDHKIGRLQDDAKRLCLVDDLKKLKDHIHTSNALHNAIMEAGSKDHPPMLAPVDACPNACEMWKATERLKQGESINVQDLETNLYWEFRKITSRDGESLESYYSRFYKMMNDLSQELKTVSYHKLYDILKQHQNEFNEIRAERLARIANPLTLVAQQQPVYHPQNHPTHYTQNYPTISQQDATRNRGNAIITSPLPIYDQELTMVVEDDEMSKDKEIDKLMALISLSFKKIYKPTNNNLQTSSNTSRSNQDNSLRINRGTGDDIDDEPDDQELEAHYMYMAQLQEVTPDATDNSGPIFDTEPLQKVPNNDNYNVFAIESEHLEQSKSLNDTYPIEQDEHNVIIDSLDMSYDREQVDQYDDDDDLANERDLLASLIEKLKCEIDDSKNLNKFLETSNKALVDNLKDEIEDFKTKNKSLESSNNHFKEANNELSKTNQLMFKNLKKFQAKLNRYHDVKYASKVEIDYAKAKGDLMSYKMVSEKTFNEYTRKINDLNQTISEMKKELFAHQDTISIMSQEKAAQIKFYKTREDKEIDIVIDLENKVKVLDNIVYKTGQSVQTLNMLNRNCRTSFAKPEFLKKAQRANHRLYDIGCYNDNLALMLAPESDEVIRLEKEIRSKLSDLIRPFDYEKLNNLYDLFVSQREKSSARRYFSERTKIPIVVPISTREPKRTVKQSVATPLSRIVASESTNHKPRHTTRKLVEIILFIIDFGCSKHMTGNLKLLTNFVEKFLGSVKFGNDQIAPILGYGDLVQGTVTIKRVYYVEGQNHNLFFVSQFCDADLEVAFRKSTCYIRNLKGNDFLIGSRSTDLYSITLQDTSSPNPICLMAKATSSQAWLWHRRLSHLNFDIINLLSKNDIVIGLPKLKFVKDHLCSSSWNSLIKLFMRTLILKGFNTKRPLLEHLNKKALSKDGNSRAYRVFIKRTRVIVETIHVNFDELPQMASDQLQDACFCWGEVEKNMGSRVGGGGKLESGKRRVMRDGGKSGLVGEHYPI
nr:integrase, catalytic region, zinc finger, CCHC-type, peptidase aspartic, catalytic [Tanacetum cinerariifolium]